MAQDLFAVPGWYEWTCPTGVTAANIECYSGGDPGNGGTGGIGGQGGDGGSYAKASITTTPGETYVVEVGAGGVSGSAGLRSTFYTPQAQAILVQAAGWGEVSVGSTVHAGGKGKLGPGQGVGGGGGGGGAGPGGNGSDASDDVGGTGATGAGDGGNGNLAAAGADGGSPGGGGGGGGTDGADYPGGNGGAGRVVITY